MTDEEKNQLEDLVECYSGANDYGSEDPPLNYATDMFCPARAQFLKIFQNDGLGGEDFSICGLYVETCPCNEI